MPRAQVAFDVYLYSVLGLVLLAVPWTPLWNQATLMLMPSGLGSFARSGWVRGVVSGLGALDLWVATQDAGLLWRLLRSSGSAVEPR